MTTRRTIRQYLAAAALVAVASGADTAERKDHDWRVYLGDAGGSHYSSLARIHRGNVTELKEAWRFRTGDAAKNSQIQCNPLIVDGVLYGTSPQLKLFALDAATGRELWRFDPFQHPGMAGGRGINRGVVFWQEGAERRLLYTASQYLHAIDPGTGKLIESFGDGGRVDLTRGLDRDVTGLYLAGTSPGAVYGDVIIMSMRVGEGPGPAAPGHIVAYNVRTGQRQWIFHTIPQPGEAGHETWPADAWQTAGAANNWQGIVIDHARGLAFVPTGSAAFDFWGGNRQGANLYANCLLALDARTGERKWHFQFTHHDLWDRDPPAAPVLCEVQRDGKKIAAVAQVTKTGHVWVFARDTGESLFPWREEPVPASTMEGETAWPTQPMPLKPEPFARQYFTEEEATRRTPEAHAAVLAKLRELAPHHPYNPPSLRGTIIFPGFDGGAEWGGPAVDPAGVLYINANEMAWLHQMVDNRKAAAHPGQAVYNQLCIGCHAPDLSGNPAANIPSLVNLGSRSQRKDFDELLRTGRGAMPSFAFIEPAQRQSLGDYLFALEAPTHGAPATERSARPTEPAKKIPFATTGYKRFLDPDGYPAVRPPWGTLNAIDLNTGEYRWRRPLGELPELTAAGVPPTGTENYGGPLVTAGGVLFIAATRDEKFRAFDTATGDLLWETQLPAGGYAVPATFAIDGKQFVVIACGGGKMGTKSGDSYVAFALPDATPLAPSSK